MNKEEINDTKFYIKAVIDNGSLINGYTDLHLFIRETENLLNYVEQLETKLKQLGRGQHILMQSRRKWKNKHYKQRRKSKELQKSVYQIYDDYQDIGKMYFDLDENVQAVKVLCRQKYTDPVVEELTNTFFDMLSKGEENK